MILVDQNISKAHDLFFKSAMTDQRVARDFFIAHLPKELLESIDLNVLELQPGSHVDGLRSEALTDMAYRTKIQGKEAYLTLFVEHQSTPDVLMPVRVEKYRCDFLWQYIKQNPGTKTIPLVVPIVLYHGRQPWKFSTDVRDMIDAPKSLIDAYAFKPFIFIDLNTIQDEALKEHLWSGVMDLALKHIFAQNVLPYVESMMSLLQRLEKAGGHGFIENVLIYLLDRGEMDQTSFLSIVRKELPPELGDKIMTVSEQLIAKGVQQGVHLAKLEDARKMLAKGLDESFIIDITDLSLEDIRAEAEKLKASTRH